MNCKTCDYPLWNLEQRQCPECGTGFLPSDFEFAVNGVRFCCPHCRQTYYGTGNSGHLVPTEFTCVNCAKPVTMNEMVLLPAQGVAEHQTRGDIMPWLERKRLGRWRGYWQTFSRAINEPQRLIAMVPAERSVNEALLYGVITMAPLLLLNGAAFFISGSASGIINVVGGGNPIISTLAAVHVPIIGCVIMAALIILCQAVTAHFILVITGGTDRQLRQAIHGASYSTPTAVWWAIPCFGLVLAPLVLIWWFVTFATMLRTTHRISRLRAGLAVSTFPVLAVASIVSLAVLSAYTATPPVFGAVQGTAAASPTALANALQSRLAGGAGYPAHGLMLLGQQVTMKEFTTRTATNVATVGDITLASLEEMPVAAAQEKMTALAAALPADVVAHRVGDYVFMYHGIAAADMSRSDLWAAIAAPNKKKPNRKITVIGADGVAYTLENEGGVDALWAQQNLLRLAAGLAVLPDPWSKIPDYVTKAGLLAEQMPDSANPDASVSSPETPLPPDANSDNTHDDEDGDGKQ